jgi:hypothetical protein
MNNDLREKLIAVAKSHAPGAEVPYAFEKRIMSRLASSPTPSVWALWGGPLWRAALSCVVITVLCGVWSLAFERKAQSADNFSQDFEAAVWAPVTQHVEDAQ